MPVLGKAVAELAEDCSWGRRGAYVNVEVQKDGNDDNENRVFYNGASLLIYRTPAGTLFKDLPDVAVIFISCFDIFGEGKVLYETVKVDKESKSPRKSPVREFYVNLTALGKNAEEMSQREREVAGMARLFKDRDAYDMKRFPEFSRRKGELLKTEEGRMKLGR